ncbi:methyltransferase domain-containing protein [Polaromonas sp.]|nr:methyltransferase domain-containing protein [Candidatus Saccharibacteria bacterium]
MTCFAGVLLVGAPYLPTLSPQVNAALKLADLKSGDTLLELGCGDGKVVLAAAKEGYRVVGYELNPIMAAIAWLRTLRYRKLVTIRCADFWRQSWPPAQAIFVFLLPKYMTKLDTKVMQQYPGGVKVVSFAFTIPDKPVQTTVDGVFLYIYK